MYSCDTLALMKIHQTKTSFVCVVCVCVWGGGGGGGGGCEE